MANRGDHFDDDEGFFESLMNRKDKVPMPQSMARMFKIVAGLVVLTVIGLIAWAVWPNGGQNTADTVPVVRADSEAYKVEPEDRGGMPIPNKDSTIFETMDTDVATDKKVESLLEDAEKPMKKEEVFESAPVVENTQPEEPEEKNTVVQPVVQEDEIVQEKPVAVTPVVKETKEEKKIDVIATLKKDAGTDKPKTKEIPVAKGNTYIQLASVKSDADAKTKWTQLKSKYASLKSLNLRVSRADLGAKGIFFRVQAGPISADSAASTCAKIKSAGGDCLVVK